MIHPQSEFIREPSLLVPRQRPLGPVRINTKGPFARGMICCFLPKGKVLRDIAAGLTSARWDSGSIDGDILEEKSGAVINDTHGVVTSSSYDCATSQNKVTPPSEFSVLFDFRKTGGGGSEYRYFYYCNTFDRFSFYSLAATDEFFLLSGSTGLFATNFIDGDRHFCITTYKGTSSPKGNLYLSTGEYGSTDIAKDFRGNDILNVGGRSLDVARWSGGEISTFVVWDRELSGREARDLVNDPYQFLVPT